jgi:hypothetical protein
MKLLSLWTLVFLPAKTETSWTFFGKLTQKVYKPEKELGTALMANSLPVDSHSLLSLMK